MSQTTGPILALGGVTLFNSMILNNRPFDPKVPIAVGIAAGAFALAEKGWPQGATALAWMAFVTVLITRVQPGVPSPVESLNTWWLSQK